MWSLSSPVQQLQSALQQITENRSIQVVLINILSSPGASKQVVEAIANYLLSQVGQTPVLSVADRVERPTGITSRSYRSRSSGTSTLRERSTSLSQLPQFVIRIIGEDLDSAKERLAAIPVQWMDNLDEAVVQTITMAKSGAKQS
jgi:succinyl-CoA synthetase beta subunit